MIQTLKCPECSAPLEYPAHGGVTMRCPYCGASVLLSGHSAPSASERRPAAIPGTVYRLSDPNPTASYAVKVVVGATLGVLALAGLIIVMIFASVRSRATQMHSSSSPTIMSTRNFSPVVPPLSAPPSPPAAPVFAHMVMEFGKEGIGAGGFTDARSIAVDNQGHVYVGEYSDGRVQVFDPQGKFISTWSVGTGAVLLNLAADRHGIVYAVTPSHLYRYEGVTGKPLGIFESLREGITQTFSDVFPALDGDLYAIGGDHEIVVIGPDGQIKKTIDAKEKVGENLSLIRVLVIGTGEIFAMDQMKGIFKFAPDGRYINRFGGGGAGAIRTLIPGQFFSPRNFAADGKGRIYVSESGASILVFDSDGNYLDSFGGTEIVFGIAITDENEIYACFRNRCSVRKFVLDKR